MVDSESIQFEAHSAKQEAALFCEKPILVLGTGTQWGKTSVGALRMKMMMHQFTDPLDNFIITSPSFPTMAQSTLPPFLRMMEGYGRHDKKENCFRMHNGGTAWLRTESDPDSIIGITNVRHIWGDEAGKYRLYFWENIQARADFCGCGIDLTTSPYSLNWIHKELIKPHRAGLRPDVLMVQAASWENPYHSLHDPARRAAKQATMDPRRFKMIYGGEWGRMEGLVYDCWDDDENLCQATDLPPGTRFVGGIDWGYYPDPFVLKVRAITPEGKQYGVSEFVKLRLTPTDIGQTVCNVARTWGMERIWADPSQPGLIEEINRILIAQKIKCIVLPADNDITRGIGLHYELIKTRKYKEFIGACPHSADERETYHYPEEKDLKPDENSKELKPVDQDNHCMDNDRYISIMEYRSVQRRTPFVPGEKPAQDSIAKRLADLRKKPRSDGGTESW